MKKWHGLGRVEERLFIYIGCTFGLYAIREIALKRGFEERVFHIYYWFRLSFMFISCQAILMLCWQTFSWFASPYGRY